MGANNSIKNKVLSGIGWSYAEKFMSVGMNLVISIVLARLIGPEAYGIIAIVTIFTSLANVFTQSGFSSALIQKKDVDSRDYSTAYVFNVGISVILYLILFFTAPLIARMYENESICLPLRVMSISIIILGFNSIQQAYVTRNMKFRNFFFANSIGTIVAGVLGVLMAYKGYGVWALVVNNLALAVINTLVLFVLVKEKPHLMFSLSKLKELLSFGWKVFTASFINVIWSDLISLVVGKKYTTTDLAYYSKGQQYPRMIYSTVYDSISKVLFPTLSKLQNDDVARLQIARRSIQSGAYVMSPILIGFAAVGNQFVELLLTAKWMFCVPFLMVAASMYLVQPIKTTCYENLKAIGKVSVYLRQEIYRKLLSLTLIVLSIIFFDSPLMVLVASVVTYYLTTLIDIFLLKRHLNYSLHVLMLDFMPSLLLALVMGIGVYFFGMLNMPLLLKLTLQIVLGAAFYIVGSLITRNRTFFYILSILKGLLRRKETENA